MGCGWRRGDVPRHQRSFASHWFVMLVSKSCFQLCCLFKYVRGIPYLCCSVISVDWDKEFHVHTYLFTFLICVNEDIFFVLDMLTGIMFWTWLNQTRSFCCLHITRRCWIVWRMASSLRSAGNAFSRFIYKSEFWLVRCTHADLYNYS